MQMSFFITCAPLNMISKLVLWPVLAHKSNKWLLHTGRLSDYDTLT